jgi:hypothetical protein
VGQVFIFTDGERKIPYKEEFGLAVDLEMMFLAKKLRLRVLQLPVDCIDRDGSHVDVRRDSMRFMRSLVGIWLLDRRIR